MKKPPIPVNEAQRLLALSALNILDTGQEERFDRIVRLAAAYFHVPIVLVSLVDENRQWFKAARGLTVRETPREVSFCGHAIVGDAPLIVPDTNADERFCDNPLVTDGPRVRFYAGQPLLSLEGYRVGTLCLIDHQPRTLDADELAALRDFAQLAENELNSAESQRAVEFHRQNQAHNAAILQTALDCMITIDRSGNVLEFNPAAERTFGYARAQVLGKEMANFIIPERLREAHRRGMNNFIATGKAKVLGKRIEITARRADRSEFPVELAITPTLFAGEVAFVAFLRDISEPLQNRRRLEVQHAIASILAGARSPQDDLPRILQLICETLDWAFGDVLLLDEQSSRLSHAFYWSLSEDLHEPFISASRSLPFSPGIGLPGRVWSSKAAVWILDVAQDANFLRVPAAIQAGLHSALGIPIVSGDHVLGVMEFFSRQMQEPDQPMLRMLEIIGSQIGQYMERRNNEARVSQLSRELYAIFSLSPDGFLSFNEHGVKSYANPAFFGMLGLNRQTMETLSEADFDRLMDEMRDPGKPYMRLSAAPDGARTLIHLLRPRSGTLERTLRLLTNASGEHLGKIVYLRDITREMEVDQMKSEFLSTAAHELRTPMASIYGFSELLLKRDYDEATRRELIETIHRQSKNLITLVNELLDLARIEARQGKDFEMRPQQLFAFVRQTVEEFIVPNDSRKIAIKLPRQRPWVAIDKDKFRQALLNILSNAHKYSPKGGPIELSSRTRMHEQQRMIGIAVRDHGIGMTENEVRRVFERFYRADNSGSIAGTGLGMSVAKEIMGIHQGSIEISSTPGEGTEVVLWLPQARAEAAARGAQS